MNQTPMVWIPVTMDTPLPKLPCLLCDKYEHIYVATTAREFYDLEYTKYWLPLPFFPYPVQGFASGDALQAIIRTLKP